MTKITKLTELLAEEKTATCGCCSDGTYPILIGDVLEKWTSGTSGEPSNFKILELARKLLVFWGECGFTKSLQEILEENIRDVDCKGCERCKKKSTNHVLVNQLTPQAKALIDFLYDLFLSPNNK